MNPQPPSSRAPLRVAIAQPAMYWTTPQNVARIVEALEVAARQGARVCLFPELALTGFHRGIREQALPGVVGPALQQVQAACRAQRVVFTLGERDYHWTPLPG